MCFGTRGVVLHKSHDVGIVQDAGGVFNMGGKENGGVGGKMVYIYSSCCDFLVHLVSLVNEHTMAQPSSCTATRRLMNKKPQNEIYSTRRGNFTTPGVALHHTPL